VLLWWHHGTFAATFASAFVLTLEIDAPYYFVFCWKDPILQEEEEISKVHFEIDKSKFSEYQL
jgi:hypothetical protein